LPPTDRRRTATPGGRALAGIRIRAAAHPGRAARRSRIWVAIAGWTGRPPPRAAAHGRLRRLDFRLRNFTLARWHIRSRLCGRRAGIESVIDGDAVASRIRDIMAQRNTWTGTAAEPSSSGRPPFRRKAVDQHRVAKKPPRARRPTPASPARFAFAGHRYRFQPPRPGRKQNDYHDVQPWKHRLHRRPVHRSRTRGCRSRPLNRRLNSGAHRRATYQVAADDADDADGRLFRLCP
jgi:hypothetical protein